MRNKQRVLQMKASLIQVWLEFPALTLPKPNNKQDRATIITVHSDVIASITPYIFLQPPTAQTSVVSNMALG